MTIIILVTNSQSRLTMRSNSPSGLVPLGLVCFLVLFHCSLADQSCKPQQSPRLSGRSDCQFQKITAREPNRRQVSEAGLSEFWDASEKDELECAGVEVVRHTIHPKGLLLPYYPSTPELVYVVRGQGLQGSVLPGCRETFETTFTLEDRREEFSDKHQKVYRYKEGDILALPAGAVHWTYNDGNTPVVAVALRDTSNVANQLDSNFKKFFLAGNPQSQMHQGEPWGRPTQPEWIKGQPGHPEWVIGHPYQPGRPFFRPDKPGLPFFRPDQPGQPIFRPYQPSQPSFRPDQPGSPCFRPDKPIHPTFRPDQPLRPTFRPDEPSRPCIHTDDPSRLSFHPSEPRRPSFRPDEPRRPDQPDEPGKQPGWMTDQPEQPSGKQLQPGRSVQPEQPGIKQPQPGRPVQPKQLSGKQPQLGRPVQPDQPDRPGKQAGQPQLGRPIQPEQAGIKQPQPDRPVQLDQPGSKQPQPSHPVQLEQPGGKHQQHGRPAQPEQPGLPGKQLSQPSKQPGWVMGQPEQPFGKQPQPGRPVQPGSEHGRPDEPLKPKGKPGQGEVYDNPCAKCRQIRGEKGHDEACNNCNQVGTQQEQKGFYGFWPYPFGQQQEQQGFNMFAGFDNEILEEVFDIGYEIVRQLKGLYDDRGLIVLAENFHVLIPEVQEQFSPYVDNGLEQTICLTQLSANIGEPAFSDVYNPRGGRISSLNSHKLPILESFQLNAERGLLYKNAVLAPHYTLNAHTIIYITSGSSRLQIVGNDGSRVFDDLVKEGQLIVVPQDFAVIKKAGEEGCEWVAFKTNDNAVTTQLAGRFSYIRSLPEEVLVNSYNISRHEAKKLKYNREEGVVLSPRSALPIEKAKNLMLNALFG